MPPSSDRAWSLPLGLRGRRLVLAVGMLAVVSVGIVMVGANVVRTATASGGHYAGGLLVLGLGLVAAIMYGVSRNTGVGVIIWLAATIVAPVAPSGLPIDQLAFAALIAVWFLEVVGDRRPFPHIGATEFLMLAFVVLSIGSMITPHALPAVDDFGVDRPLLPLMLTSTLYPFAAFVLARSTLVNAQEVRRLLRFLVALGLYLGITNIVWIMGLDSLVVPSAILDPSIGSNADRGRGIFLNPAATGFVLVACFVGTMYLAAQRGNRWRIPLVTSGVIMLVGVGLTQTRSAWLAAGIVIIFSAVAFSGFRRWYVLMLVAIGLIIVGNWSTFTSDDRTEGGVTSANEANDRINASATALWGMEHEPVFGWGLGRFSSLNTVHHQAWGDTPWQRGYGILAHDTQLGIGAELGLVGLALWIGIMASILIASRRAWRALPRSGLVSRWLAVAFWCICLAWIATASLIDVRLFAFVSAILFLFGGMVIGVTDRVEEDARREATR